MASIAGQSSGSPGQPSQLQVDSVAGVASPISSESGPEPSPVEAIVHTGSANGIDPVLYSKWIAHKSFRWDTTQAPGTKLSIDKIHPDTIHPYTKHIGKMYNVSVGGFDIRMMVNGTALHGGELIAARIPPNIDPSTIKGLQDLTTFEYVLIDPKNTGVISLHVMDQRNKLYHYTNDTGPDSIGGYFVVAVYAPLITSSTGNQSIVCCIQTRPARDFMFLQLRPLPGVEEKECFDREVDILANALSVKDQPNTLCNFTKTVSFFKVQPAAMEVPPTSLVGSYDFKGKKLGNETTDNYPAPATAFEVAKSGGNSSSQIWIEPPSLAGLPKSVTCNISIAHSKTKETSFPFKIVESVKEPGRFIIYDVGGSVGETVDRNCFYDVELYLETDRKVPQKNSKESYFTFETGKETSSLSSIQPSSFAEKLKSEQFTKVLDTQTAMIVDMLDAEQDVPVRRLKIYPSGIITTTGSTNAIYYPAQKYNFKFVQFSKLTEPIPSPPKNYLRNDLISRWASNTHEQMN